MLISISQLKQKKVAIPLLAILLISIYAFVSRAPEQKDSTAVETRKTVTVFDPQALASSSVFIEANGTVETLEAVDLSSEVSARVTRINVALGDTVRRGQTLVVFNNADLVATLAGAEADLESTRANKKAIEAQYRTQEATVVRVETSAANIIAAAESSLQSAENNLRQSASANDTQVVRDAYVTMLQTLQGAQDTLQSTLTSIDIILGIDNETANDAYEDILSVQQLSKRSAAENLYYEAKKEKERVDSIFQSVTTASTNAAIDTAIVTVTDALSTYRSLALAMSDMLDATPQIGVLNATALDGLKSSIEGVRTQVAAQSSNVTAQMQRIDSAKNSFGSLQIAYDKALRDVAAAKSTAAADIAAAHAQLSQIEASLELQDAQIKSAAARVASIRASLAKTVITAPISGTIASLPATVGELMSPGQLAVRIVNTGSYQVKTYIAADAVSQVATGNIARIDGRYDGLVTNVSPSIDPSTNKVEVTVLVTSDDPVLISEQFVSVQIEQSQDEASDVTLIPLESVRLTSEGATVLVVPENGVLEARMITIGQVVGSRIEADIRDIDQPIVTSVRGLEAGEQVMIQS